METGILYIVVFGGGITHGQFPRRRRSDTPSSGACRGGMASRFPRSPGAAGGSDRWAASRQSGFFAGQVPVEEQGRNRMRASAVRAGWSDSPAPESRTPALHAPAMLRPGLPVRLPFCSLRLAAPHREPAPGARLCAQAAAAALSPPRSIFHVSRLPVRPRASPASWSFVSCFRTLLRPQNSAR